MNSGPSNSRNVLFVPNGSVVLVTALHEVRSQEFVILKNLEQNTTQKKQTKTKTNKQTNKQINKKDKENNNKKGNKSLISIPNAFRYGVLLYLSNETTE